MQDIVFSFDLLTLGLLFCLVFPIYWFILRNQIFYWFDPLLVFVFFNSISVAFVIYLYFFMHTIKMEYMIGFSFCIIGFLGGVLFGGRRGLPKWNIDGSGMKKYIDLSNNYSLLMDVFMVISLSIMFFSNAIMLAVKGTLPIFSANPSEAKILLYTGGWGIVKRINYALVNYTLAIPLVKIFHPGIQLNIKQKIFHIICMFTCVLLIITMGSKSSLLIVLNLFFAIILVNRTFGISLAERTKSIINTAVIVKWAKYVFGLAVGFMFLVVILSGVETSSSDSILTRFVASGDAFYFFYVFDLNADFHHSMLDFFPHILNPLLAMLRFTDYEFAIGAYIIHYSVGLPLDALSTFGPNAQHPLEGLIYFGKYGAPFYSFLIGYIISAIRVGLLHKLGPYPNCFLITIYVVLSSLILTAGTDMPLFMQIFYDMVIFGAIILLISAALSKVLVTTNKA